MPRDIGTTLIEPKTPFYGRFDLLALILPHGTNNAISGSLEAKATRLRAANPEKVGNLANGVAVPDNGAEGVPQNFAEAAKWFRRAG